MVWIRQLFVDPVPVQPIGQLHELVLQIDERVEPGLEKVVLIGPFRLLWPHPILPK